MVVDRRSSRLLRLLTPVVLALGLAGAAGATTAPNLTTTIRVILASKTVTFDPSKLRPDTDTTFIVKVINDASVSRWFRLGARQTPLLRHGGTQLFYYSFSFAGPVAWRSGGTGALLKGRILVHPAPALGVITNG